MKVIACLIVKNEEAVIDRCLQSLVGKVDSVLIIDTGSTDNTLKVLETPPLPTRVVQRPWVNFGHNRSELILLASPDADYLLMLDADQTVEGQLPERLEAGAYMVKLRSGGSEWVNKLLVNAKLPWRYEGVVHEYMTCDMEIGAPNLEGFTIVEHADGGHRPSGQQPRWVEDAKLLEAELARDPSNARNTFYLARTYDDLAATMPEEAVVQQWNRKARFWYHKRAEMGGFQEEVFFSLLRIGQADLPESMTFLFKAMEICPCRWEPIHAICHYLNKNGMYQAAYSLSKRAIGYIRQTNGLFYLSYVYDYGLEFEHTLSSYYIGFYHECKELSHALIARDLPTNIHLAVVRNMTFLEGKL